MKTKIIIGLFLGFWMTTNAQVRNDGGTIEVFPGVSLVVHMNVENVNSGNLIVNGTLVIKGEFMNELGSTLTTGPGALLSIDSSSSETMIVPKNEDLDLLNPRSLDEGRDTLKIHRPANLSSERTYGVRLDSTSGCPYRSTS